MQIVKRLRTLSLSLASLGLVAGGAVAQEDTTERGQTGTEMEQGAEGQQQEQQQGQTAEQTLNDLHQTSQSEIQVAELARQQAASEDVKEYAETVAEDHRDLAKKVEEVAKEENLTLQQGAPQDPQQQQQLQQLQSLSGEQFDHGFLQQQQQGHEEAISQLEQARENIDNEEVKEVVDEAIDKMNEHNEKASSLMDEMMKQQGQQK